MQLDLFGGPDVAVAEVAAVEPHTSTWTNPETAAEIQGEPSAQVGAAEPDDAVRPILQQDLDNDEANGSPSNQALKSLTLADAKALYENAVSIHKNRVKIRSAMSGMARVLGRPLDQIPADPELLGPLIAQAVPARGGMKPLRWQETKSWVRCGLRDLGIEIMAARDETPLKGEWADLWALCNKRNQIGLGKFMKFCARKEVMPCGVTIATFEAYREELAIIGMHPDAEAALRQTADLWNKASAAIWGWPSLVVPITRQSRQYALPWEAFPKSLVDDVGAFLKTKEFGDVFADDYSPRVRPATTKSRQQLLRRAASILVITGTPIDRITSMAVLCEAENVRTVLRFSAARHADGMPNEADMNYPWLLRTIARYWIKDRDAADAISEISGDIWPGVKSRSGGGMKPRNRERLRQFDQPQNFEALVDLPWLTLKRVSKKAAPTYYDAVQVMYALMIAILLNAPMRSKNLVELELGTQFLETGKGKQRTHRIHLPESVTKTRRAYDAPLPDHLLKLIDAWQTTYRKLICPGPSKYLFPTVGGELRSRDSIADQVKDFIFRTTGLKMNLHLFRHLIAKIILDHDPNAMETVRQLLGHSSIRTTEKAYAELRTDPAFHALDDALRKVMYRPIKRGRARRVPL